MVRPLMLCLCCNAVAAGILTFWLSRGRGTLDVGSADSSTLYALLSTGETGTCLEAVGRLGASRVARYGCDTLVVAARGIHDAQAPSAAEGAPLAVSGACVVVSGLTICLSGFAQAQKLLIAGMPLACQVLRCRTICPAVVHLQHHHVLCAVMCCPVVPSETCYMEDERDAGIRAVKTPLDPRSPYFTVMRNVSQIESAVAHYEAAARGADLVGRGRCTALGGGGAPQRTRGTRRTPFGRCGSIAPPDQQAMHAAGAAGFTRPSVTNPSSSRFSRSVENGTNV